MSKLKISVIIPSYNHGLFIEKTILSILSQNYSNIEVIVIDGGSSDNTTEILKKYSSRLAYWQSRPDKGQSEAIAVGFKYASGDIFCWLNSDDIFLPGALSIVAQQFSTTNADVVYGNKWLINVSGDKIGERLLTPFLPLLIKEAYLCGGFGIYQPSSFWTAKIYNDVGGVDSSLRFCIDNDLFNKFVIYGAKFRFVNSYLSGFRVHKDSKTSTLQRVAEEERALLYRKYVIERGVHSPSTKRLMARLYRIFFLSVTGKLPKVLFMKYFHEFKWVP